MGYNQIQLKDNISLYKQSLFTTVQHSLCVPTLYFSHNVLVLKCLDDQSTDPSAFSFVIGNTALANGRLLSQKWGSLETTVLHFQAVLGYFVSTT